MQLHFALGRLSMKTYQAIAFVIIGVLIVTAVLTYSGVGQWLHDHSWVGRLERLER